MRSLVGFRIGQGRIVGGICDWSFLEIGGVILDLARVIGVGIIKLGFVVGVIGLGGGGILVVKWWLAEVGGVWAAVT